jgi:small subunit ribosomal protein S1
MAKKPTDKSLTEKKTVKKVSPKKETVKKETVMKTASKTIKAKKETSKKAASKKTSPKKENVKKAASKKTTPKKETVKKVAAEKIKKVESLKDETVFEAGENISKVEVAETTEDVAETQDQSSPIKEKETAQSEFLTNFNWHNYKEGIDLIEDRQLDEFEKLVKENFVDTSDDDVIEGEVVYMTDREAIIDINAKSEGVISLNEFRYNPDLKLGDKVEVIVDMREDKTGQLVLSHRKARVIKAWDRVNNAHDNGEIVSGFVKCRTKGGMIVDVFGIEAFLPGSQIDVKPIRDYDQYVNKTMEFKVVKINQQSRKLI